MELKWEHEKNNFLYIPDLLYITLNCSDIYICMYVCIPFGRTYLNRLVIRHGLPPASNAILILVVVRLGSFANPHPIMRNGYTQYVFPLVSINDKRKQHINFVTRDIQLEIYIHIYIYILVYILVFQKSENNIKLCGHPTIESRTALVLFSITEHLNRQCLFKTRLLHLWR